MNVKVTGHIRESGARLYTFQDFERAQNKPEFCLEAVKRHLATDAVQTAQRADLYDHQMNKTINEVRKFVYSVDGTKVADPTASNNKIACNLFHRLNTQRCMYSLGKGMSYANNDSGTKQKVGLHFDHDVATVAYNALIHGVSFGFWNFDRLYCFPLTEFVPLWDEYDGTLRAGIRFWRIAATRPLTVVLYEEDGYTRFVTDTPDLQHARLGIEEEKRAYVLKTVKAPADETAQVVGAENYSSLPIVPMWGSKLHQSTLIGMERSIDSYDLIRSGFANDLTDCAQIYWLVENRGGMTDKDLARFRDRLTFNHVAEADTDDGGGVKPYVQEVPYQARQQYLDGIRAGIYEDFGGLDVHTVAAGATNDHIDAAYQPMDENASDFEYQVEEFVEQVLRLMGVDDTPVFTRTRISNQLEQVQMLVQEAQWLDDETILKKLPNVEPDEVQGILDKLAQEEREKVSMLPPELQMNAVGQVVSSGDDDGSEGGLNA